MKNSTPAPLISVVIPVYNGQKYLRSAIESILGQTFRNFEIIAIDDGSKDHSYQILRALAQTDQRLRIFRNSRNRNIVYTLNRGVKLARGKYIARMDCDDIAVEDRLKIQLRYLRAHPSTVVVGSNCYTIDQNNNFIGYKRFPISDEGIRAMIFLINPMQHPTMMINRSLLPKDFVWYNQSIVHGEDLDLLFRLAKIGPVHNLKKPLLFYRLHLNSKTFMHPKENYLDTKIIRKLAIEKYGYQKPFYLRLVNRIQELMIALLPGIVIYSLYNLIRDLSFLVSQRKNHQKVRIQRELDAIVPRPSVSI